MRSYFLSVFFAVVLVNAKAQSTVSSYIQSVMVLISEDEQGKAIEYSVTNSYMILNLATGDFVLNADLSELRTGNKRSDSLVARQGEQYFSFKGNLGQNLLVFNQQQKDDKTYPLQGTFSLNAISLDCMSEFHPIYLGDKSENKNYRIDFKLSLEAEKVKIKGLETNFTRQVVFEIRSGKINTQ